jgi:ribosomal protein S15P/S13E
MIGFDVGRARIAGRSIVTLRSRTEEIFLVTSWAEHLRQHAQQTRADEELERRLHSYVSGQPEVHHLIYAYSKEI